MWSFLLLISLVEMSTMSIGTKCLSGARSQAENAKTENKRRKELKVGS